jgi:hypothetical protein
MKSNILTESMGVMTKNKTYNCLKKESNFSIFGCKAAAAVVISVFRILTNFGMLIMLLNLKEKCQ